MWPRGGDGGDSVAGGGESYIHVVDTGVSIKVLDKKKTKNKLARTVPGTSI